MARGSASRESLHKEPFGGWHDIGWWQVLPSCCLSVTLICGSWSMLPWTKISYSLTRMMPSNWRAQNLIHLDVHTRNALLQFSVIGVQKTLCVILLTRWGLCSLRIFSIETSNHPTFCAHVEIFIIVGSSRWSSLADYESAVGVLGTGFWRAPEILKQLKGSAREGSTSGVKLMCTVQLRHDMLFEIWIGHIPFKECKHYDYDHVLKGARLSLPDHVPSWSKDLIQRCWHQNLSERPSFQAIIIMEFISCCLRQYHQTCFKLEKFRESKSQTSSNWFQTEASWGFFTSWGFELNRTPLIQ